MRCPKCSYITFDSGERCRNCGYEFALTVPSGTFDLPIQTGDEAEGPLADFSLEDLDEPATPAQAAAPVAAPVAAPPDLPLFGARDPHDDRPLVTVPAVPRTPLSVRKAAPIVQRPAAKRHVDDAPRLDLALPEEPRAADPAAVPMPPPRVDAGATTHGSTTAGAGSRILAALVDAALLGAIDLTVLHFTLKLCGLTYAEVTVIPPAPFLAFLFLLNGGYAAAFTAAGGQSIGKMVAGIRVVPSDEDTWGDRVPLGQAVFRSAAYLISALPAGLGFLPGLIGAEKRAVHDRLARTRVVRMSERSE